MASDRLLGNRTMVPKKIGIGSRRIPSQPFVIYHGNAAC